MYIDRTTHVTHNDVSIDEALQIIEKLTAAIRHAQKFQYCSVSMPATNIVGGKGSPGSVVYNVTVSGSDS